MNQISSPLLPGSAQRVKTAKSSVVVRFNLQQHIDVGVGPCAYPGFGRPQSFDLAHGSISPHHDPEHRRTGQDGELVEPGLAPT